MCEMYPVYQTVQLIMTVGVSAICISSEPVKLFLQSHPSIVQLSGFACLFLLLALMVKRQEFPVGHILNYQKCWIFGQKQNFGQKSKFCSKIEILV